MKKIFSATIYFFISATLIVDGFIVKYSLVDTDLGTRFKNFNHSLLVSDIIFLYALFLAIIGLIFHVIRKSEKSTLKDSTVIISAILIIPISLVLALTPILETIYPGKVGDSILSSMFNWLTSIGTFAAMAWIIMLPINIIKQTYLILTSKEEKKPSILFKNDTQSMMMKQFRIKENGFNEIRKQILVRMIPLVVISASFGLVIVEYNSASSGRPDINVFPIVIPIILGAFSYGIYKAVKRQKLLYETYVVKFDDDCLIREQANTPTIKILYKDIKKITKPNLGGIVIVGNNSSNVIFVPAQIDDMPGFEDALLANCTTQISLSKPLIQKLIIPLVLAILALMAVTYISTNKVLVSISGTILTAIMIVSFIKIQTNKNIDRKTRRSSYWVIVVMLSIIGVVISKLMNVQ